MEIHPIYYRNIDIHKLSCITKIRPEHKKREPLQFRI